jgi:lipopolysaccharide/colanic/teichoic acid biosynthesis glycosyltransferase
MKRLLDVTLAGVALVLGAPLLTVLAVAVKLDTRGPALFVQTRIGRGERPFRIVKLRTMTTGEHAAAQVTAAGDPRITRLGALLRKTKLDELPQLWNVVRGDMSIVGPRPEVPRYVEHYRPEWMRLFSVRPGLTDLASLAFRDEELLLDLADDRERAYLRVVMPMKLDLALEGLEHASLLADLSVIAQTAVAVVRRSRPTPNPIFLEAARRIAELNDENSA